ncbi:hypothetical protein NFD58_04160 [Staphylococcus epidermidis]|nr:hypothetical protein [Staphylococcus epidermidis]
MPKNCEINVTMYVTKANFFKVVWKRFLNKKSYHFMLIVTTNRFPKLLNFLLNDWLFTFKSYLCIGRY